MKLKDIEIFILIILGMILICTFIEYMGFGK